MQINLAATKQAKTCFQWCPVIPDFLNDKIK